MEPVIIFGRCLMITAEILNRIAGWRAKQAAGTMTLEEEKEAIIVLREWRRSAAGTEKAKATKKKSSRTTDDLFNELDSA